MRVIFLTLRPDNLPETGKRQYENKQDANLTRRHGVDCTTIRHEKICAVIFPPNETRHAFRCGATSEELNCLKLPEANGLPDRVTAPVVASLQRAAQRNPDLDRFERGCMAAPAAAVGFLKGERLFNP
jgi:hypothetical protein